MNHQGILSLNTDSDLAGLEWPRDSASVTISQMLLMLQVLLFGRVFEYQHCGPVLESDGGIFPGGASGKQHACQCRRHKRHGFDPWLRKIPWRRAWQLTPVFLPAESHRQRSLVDYSPGGPKESDMIEATQHAHACTQMFQFFSIKTLLSHIMSNVR